MTPDGPMAVDVAVIGAGIAGAAAAYEIAATHRTVLLEREEHPGYHTTGRSAALYTENYGNAVIRALTIASRPFFERPPAGFADYKLLHPRGVLWIATSGQDAFCAEHLAAGQRPGGKSVVREIARDEAFERLPVLSREYLQRAFYEADAMDLDVQAIHQGFLGGFKTRGGRLLTGAEVRGLARDKGVWRISSAIGEIVAACVVDAAGAWADEIARLAGVSAVGLVPKRRTAFIFDPVMGDPPRMLDPSPWPMACDVAEGFYFKPEAGRILVSPADETPSPPCDAQPEEIDIAEASARLESATTLKVTRIVRKWAGLRSFVADKSPVAGEAPDAPGFFWLAGQGGYGIMTSPALGRTIAALVRGQDIPKDIGKFGVNTGSLSPRRLLV